MQDLIIYNQKEVIIQVNGKTYQDTNENFLADYGKVVKYEAIDYNRHTKYCWLNGDAFQKYPNDVCEDILNSIDALITNKEKREYVAPTLDELKQAKLTELKTIRDAEEVKPIAYNGNLFDFDDKARERMRIAQQALSDNNIPNQLWTTYDNTQVELTVQDFKNINTLAAKRSGELHIHYNTLKQEVLACTTNEDVEKIEW